MTSQAKDGAITVFFAEEEVGNLNKNEASNARGLTIGAPGWGKVGEFASATYEFDIQGVTQEDTTSKLAAWRLWIGRIRGIVAGVLRFLFLALILALVGVVVWLHNKLQTLREISRQVRQKLKVVDNEIIELKKEIRTGLSTNGDGTIGTLCRQVKQLGELQRQIPKQPSTTSTPTASSRDSQRLIELSGKLGSLENKVDDHISETRKLRQRTEKVEADVDGIMGKLTEPTRSAATSSQTPGATQAQTAAQRTQTSTSPASSPVPTVSATPRPPVKTPAERWREGLDNLLRQPAKEGIEQLADYCQLLERSYQILVEEWGGKSSPQEDMAAWGDTWWLSKLDEALYSDAQFTVSSSLGRDITNRLYDVEDAVRAVQQERIARLREWHVERIEGQPGVSRLEARVLEKDGKNGPEATTERHKDSTFCRIVPGRGGYRIDGRLICPTFAVFYQYREA